MNKGFAIASAAASIIATTSELSLACDRTGTGAPCTCSLRSDGRPHAPHIEPLSLRSGPASSGPAESTQVVHVFSNEYSINEEGFPIVDATINVGDTIRWEWDSGFHTVTSVPSSSETYESGPKFPVDDYEHTFNQAGTFWYYCQFHGFPAGNGTADGMAGFITVLAPTVNATWNLNGNGDWSAGGNWTGGNGPNGVGHVANFGTIITAPRSVVVDQARTVGTMNFTSPFSYTIAGPATLTLQGGSGLASISVSAGTHTISAAVVLNDNLNITTAAGTGIALTGNLNASGRILTKQGSGSVQFENVRATSLNVDAGLARIRAKATPNDSGGTSVVRFLSISGGAQLDLTNNSAIFDYDDPDAPEGDVRAHLLAGRLTSSSANANRNLGYADNHVLGLMSFAGQEVDTTSVLIKYTYKGDSDLDGDVDVADLGKLATSWQTAAVWSGGDFDYNGTVDVNDLGMLATNWQAGVGNPLGPDLASALASLGLPNVSVPEPGGVLAIGTSALRVLRRRRFSL
jgi:plastocyanin